MQAEIITIGDEILIGQILDSNSKWIAEELNKIGVSVYQITSIQDNRAHILKALKEACEAKSLTPQEGFFFGSQDPVDAEGYTSVLNFIMVAEEHIRDGFVVFVNLVPFN